MMIEKEIHLEERDFYLILVALTFRRLSIVSGPTPLEEAPSAREEEILHLADLIGRLEAVRPDLGELAPAPAPALEAAALGDPAALAGEEAPRRGGVELNSRILGRIVTELDFTGSRMTQEEAARLLIAVQDRVVEATRLIAGERVASQLAREAPPGPRS